ncbi:MAG: FkbM family methyltransferase [Variibacter sp.]
MLDTLRTARGIGRSLRTYYGNRSHAAAMDRLYAGFVQPGDLVFDIGAHVGDRVSSFRRLGARVVAVEPQPALVRVLRFFYRRTDVVILASAVGRTCGTTILKINIDNPTVSSASEDFIAAAQGAAGWEAQRWTRSLVVPVTTLDALIAAHGMPSFIKIDVEGFEEEVLLGLSRPARGLSFEFTTIHRDAACRSIERCRTLGYTRFNAALGETQILSHPHWMSAEEIAAWLIALPHAANSGDVYAVLS